MQRYRAFLALSRQLCKSVQTISVPALDRNLHRQHRRSLVLASRALCRLDLREKPLDNGGEKIHPTELEVNQEEAIPVNQEETAPSLKASVGFQQSPDHHFAVKLKGLPYSATEDEVLEFLGVESGVRRDCLHITHCQFGSGFVFLQDEEQLRKVLRKHRMFMGKRYIDISEISLNLAYDEINKYTQSVNNSRYITLRGLPYDVTKRTVADFFSDLNIEDNRVWLCKTPSGYLTGQAYIELLSDDEANKALRHHKCNIGNRYIEVYPSTQMAYRKAVNRGKERYLESIPATPQTPNLGKHTIKMRGLPYTAGLSDLVQFFKPLEPTSVDILKNEWGRSSGEAIVKFANSNDMVEALKRDRGYIGNRYIELIADL